MRFFGGAVSMPVRYFARLPYVTSFAETDPLPYEHDQYMKIAARAAIYALNKYEYDVSQDLALLELVRDKNGSTQQ